MKKIPLIRYKPRKKVFEPMSALDATYSVSRQANITGRLQRIRNMPTTPDLLAIGTHDARKQS